MKHSFVSGKGDMYPAAIRFFERGKGIAAHTSNGGKVSNLLQLT